MATWKEKMRWCKQQSHLNVSHHHLKHYVKFNINRNHGQKCSLCSFADTCTNTVEEAKKRGSLIGKHFCYKENLIEEECLRQQDVREIGNPSTRKEAINEAEKCPTCNIRLAKVEGTDPKGKVKKGLKCDKCGYYQEETQTQPKP